MPAATLPPESPIILDLRAPSDIDAIESLAATLSGSPGVRDHARFLADVIERQKIHPPLLGHGIALPHARTPAVSEIVFAAARCRRPVLFGESPVKLIFLFGVPPHRISEYLSMTSSLARRLRDPAVLEALLRAPDLAQFRRELEGA